MSNGHDRLSLISIDPGGTTGWSVFGIDSQCMLDPDVSILQSVCHYSFGQISGDEMGQVDALVNLIDCWPGAPVVIESFEVRQIAVELSPVRISAGLQYGLLALKECYGWKRSPSVFEQSPSLAKSTASDDRLKRWGYHELTMGQPHARDATRHGLTFLRRAKAHKQLINQAWPRLIRNNARNGLAYKGFRQ